MSHLSEQLDSKVDLKGLKLSGLWPIGVRLHGLKMISNKPLYHVEIDRILFTANPLGPVVTVTVEKPLVRIEKPKVKPEVNPNTVTSAESGSPSKIPGFVSNLDVRFLLNDGVFVLKDEEKEYRAIKTKIDVKKSRLLDLQSPVQLGVDSEIHYLAGSLEGATALHVESRDLKLGPAFVSSENLTFDVSGVILKASGRSDLNADIHNWKLTAAVSDLSKLPKPPDLIPAKDWKGKIDLEATLDRNKEQTHAQGSIKLASVSMNLGLSSESVSIKGPAALNFESQFRYQLNKAGSVYEVKNASGGFDLSGTDVQYGNLFNKPANIPLTFLFKGDVTQELVSLEQFDIQLHTLKAQAQGNLALKGAGQINWQTSRVQLAGWEKLILPLNGSPLTGQMELKGVVSGSLADMQALRIDVSRFQFQDVKGVVKYKSKDLEVNGSAEASAEGHASIKGKEVKSVSLVARLNANSLAMKSASGIEKKSGEPLQMNLSLKEAGSSIGIDKAEITHPFGHVKLNGKISNPMDPSFELRVVGDLPNLDQMKTRVPQMKDLPLSGSLNANIGLNGKMDSKQEWSNWPMRVVGSVKLAMPKYEMPKAKPGEKEKEKPPVKESASKPPAPLLTKGRLTENLDLALDVSIAKIVKDTLTIDNASMNGRLAQGRFSGNVVMKTMGGSLAFKKLNLNLFESDPVVTTDVQIDGMRSESVLEFVQPSFKDAAHGPIHGQMNVETQLPSSNAFMEKLKVSGAVNSDDLVINLKSLSEMINEQVSRIPGVPKNAVQLDSLRGKMSSKFNLANQKVDPFSVDDFDRTGSELHLHGMVSLDKTVDLSGEFRWANAPFTGCIKEGNSDDKGRVVVPVALRGNVTSPSWNIAGEVLSKMGQKALKCEAVKAIQKNIPEQIPGDLGKALKGILGN